VLVVPCRNGFLKGRIDARGFRPDRCGRDRHDLMTPEADVLAGDPKNWLWFSGEPVGSGEQARKADDDSEAADAPDILRRQTWLTICI